MILKSKNKNVMKIKNLLDTTILLISILDINEIVVSNKVSFNRKGFNYFICYKEAKII